MERSVASASKGENTSLLGSREDSGNKVCRIGHNKGAWGTNKVRALGGGKTSRNQMPLKGRRTRVKEKGLEEKRKSRAPVVKGAAKRKNQNRFQMQRNKFARREYRKNKRRLWDGGEKRDGKGPSGQ